jgi:glyoxylase-like metal-dependent hydrolase (beta-lactamase superfamily II)
MQLNGTSIALKHYAPAHTDSDISVHFADADILHVGDTFWNGYYPFIDYSTGGSIDGTIRATEANLAKVTDKMIVIPGMVPLATSPNSLSIAIFYLRRGIRSRPSKRKAGLSTKLLAPNQRPPRMQSGAEAL